MLVSFGLRENLQLPPRRVFRGRSTPKEMTPSESGGAALFSRQGAKFICRYPLSRSTLRSQMRSRRTDDIDWYLQLKARAVNLIKQTPFVFNLLCKCCPNAVGSSDKGRSIIPGSIVEDDADCTDDSARLIFERKFILEVVPRSVHL